MDRNLYTRAVWQSDQLTQSSNFDWGSVGVWTCYLPSINDPERKSSNKADLKKCVEMSSRTVKPDDAFLDGNTMLYHIHWSDQGTVNDFVNNSELRKRKPFPNVLMICDRRQIYTFYQRSSTTLINTREFL